MNGGSRSLDRVAQRSGRPHEHTRFRFGFGRTHRPDPRHVDDSAQLGALGEPLHRSWPSCHRARVARARQGTGGACAAIPRRSGASSITDIVDHYDKIIRGLDRPPIIIGHSFGGLLTQLLLDRGLGAAGVALVDGRSQGRAQAAVLDAQGRLAGATQSGQPQQGDAADSGTVPLVLHERAQQGAVGFRSTTATTSRGAAALLPGRASPTSTRTPRRRSTTRTRHERRFCSSPAPRIGSVPRR